MTRRDATCDRCTSSLIEIDHYGERLLGCIECNVWRGSKQAFIVELSVEDFQALRELEIDGRQVSPSGVSAKCQ